MKLKSKEGRGIGIPTFSYLLLTYGIFLIAHGIYYLFFEAAMYDPETVFIEKILPYVIVPIIFGLVFILIIPRFYRLEMKYYWALLFSQFIFLAFIVIKIIELQPEQRLFTGPTSEMEWCTLRFCFASGFLAMQMVYFSKYKSLSKINKMDWNDYCIFDDFLEDYLDLFTIIAAMFVLLILSVNITLFIGNYMGIPSFISIFFASLISVITGSILFRKYFL
ncbi:MAG: hypothetical protein FP824_02560 [Euryarchaeota archaeon]|nr:hypothetical protein [Euryarchaeota archaeon]